MMTKTSIPALPPRIFISYSHADRDFVAKLAGDLAKNRIVVWWDEWEIKVGDSLLKKIEDGILGSAYLAVVLSANSVNSAWVQEELKAAIARQLEEKRTIVLPLLVSDCQIPLFLKEKRYADFRKDYDKGLKELLRAIQPPDIKSHGHSEEGQYHNDYAFEWGMFGDRHGLNIEITHHSPTFPYTINCKIQVIASETLSKRLHSYEEAGFPWAARAMLLVQLEDTILENHPVILIEGNQEAKKEYQLIDPKRGTGINIQVRARRLGRDPGSNLLFEWGTVFAYIANSHREGINASLLPDERAQFQKWLKENPI